MAALALLAAGWFAAGMFRSPEQIAAAASPPPPSEVTATVDRGDLRDEINLQSTVRRERTEDVIIPSAEDTPVVTANPIDIGGEVLPGALVLEVNGSPVFALPGEFPFYRDITLGATGTDVRQLQEGLRKAGLDVTVDGMLGPSTRAAVEQLYRNAGYTARSAEVEVQPQPNQGEEAGDKPDGGDAVDDAVRQREAPREIVVVDASSFVTIRTTPSFLTTRPAVGTTGEDATKITVTNGPLLAFASVTSSTAAILTLEMLGTATLPDGTEIALSVSALGSPDEDGMVTATLTPNDQALPDDLLNAEFTISLTRQLAAEDALIVPTRAVSPQGTGQQVVLRRSDDGTFSEVHVEEIAALGGRSAITVLDDGDLAEGDEVMVE
ncbi:peptidoglycan-binding domain-containing protein [Microbacterium suaedae]|uniref:peptidoglycan-binding domain-containing protein n=1 Tax=Microbacterium suaedae TaxID=2067813 RepID=UPI000DA136ED|nr:peptidoglycan-binding domain-containing protein [Microbacterium suaedae]